MNAGKATPIYQRPPQPRSYLKSAARATAPTAAEQGQAKEFVRETVARKDRLGLTVRVKLLKVLTLTLLRELEGVDKEPENKSVNAFDLQSEVQHFEAELIRSALIMTGGRLRRAARLLGVKVTTLHTKIRRHGLCDAVTVKTSSGQAAHYHDEPTIVEAVKASMQLVGAILQDHEETSSDSTPEIHVTGSN